MARSDCNPVLGCACLTATATKAAKTRNGILSMIDRLNDRFSSTRSRNISTEGKGATDSFPSKGERNSKRKTMYQPIAPRCLYFRYARTQGSTNAAATKSLRLEIQA